MKQSNRWSNKCAGLLLGLVCISSVFLPQETYAADTCECFCGDIQDGALAMGTYESANECAQFCAEAGSAFSFGTAYVGCYTDEAMYPENSNLCWTSDECTKYPVEVGSTEYFGSWGGQSAHCGTESITGEAMGYCYGPLIPVVLNVPILGVTEVGTIGDYINLVYRYAIPVAAMFATLMFTIAGFQYMTAGGDKGAVAKAKGRMVNTVTGIVLLMSVYTIAYLIDPRLTRFNELRPPLIKRAVIADDTTTCEALFGYGFCIDGTCPDSGSIQGECGEKGKITGDDQLDENIINAPEVGDECLYSGCGTGKVCVLKGDNSGGVCTACNEVSGSNEDLGITPSAATCSAIEAQLDEEDKNEDHEYVCYFDNDLNSLADAADFVTTEAEEGSATSAGVDECVQFYTDGDQYMNCNKLREYAEEQEDGCMAYELVNADSYGIGWSGNLAEITGFGSADSIEDFKEAFGNLCKQDVCSVKDAGGVTQGSCNFIDTNSLQDFLDPPVSLLTIFDEYGCVGSETLKDAE